MSQKPREREKGQTRHGKNRVVDIKHAKTSSRSDGTGMAVGIIILIILGVIGLIFLLGLLFELFWNFVIVNIVTIAKPTDYWTSLLFVVLFAVLFGGIFSFKRRSD